MHSDLVPKKTWLSKRQQKANLLLARILNPVLLNFRYGYVFKDGKWRFRRVKGKPKRIRHTFEDGTPNWDMDGAAPLPFEENTARRMIEIKPQGKVGKRAKKSKRRKRRYIPAQLGVEGFFRKLNENNISYAALRWFDELPDVAPGEDIDLLFADEDMAFIDTLFIPHRKRGAIKCDVYSAGGLYGSNFEGLPYYEQRLATDILDHAELVNGLVMAPDTERHFLSLAYHAVYHKAHNSGLPVEAGGAPLKQVDDHDYAAVLGALAEKLGFDVELSIFGLHHFLTEKDWAPATDTIRKLSGTRPVLKLLLDGDATRTDRELSVFVVREWARERNLLPWITANLRYYGFDVKMVHELNEEERQAAATRIRGGNWNRGPYPVSGGKPYAVIAACDYAPEPPDEELRRAQPYAINARSVAIKALLRQGINRVLPARFRTNPVHSADDEVEAWEYLEICCPSRVADIRARVKEGYHGDPTLKLRLHRGKRAISYLVFRDGKPCVLKLFSDHADARRAYNAEMRALELFKGKPWAPNWVDTGPNWILEEFYPQARRLDRVAETMARDERVAVAAQAVGVLRDIYDTGYAHRDVHAENFFLVDGQLVLIDFETLGEQEPDVRFESSYDITGTGMDSPFKTGAMCYSNRRSDRSLARVLGVRFDEALEAERNTARRTRHATDKRTPKKGGRRKSA
ncbi:MAG: hypothetical protein KDJ69_13835 [Nitratireductor sp.]|nr:hypothetical protein [Nitratireductor sp.]